MESARRDRLFNTSDMNARKELAKQIGLSEVPPPDPDAYDRLPKIFAKYKFLRNVDPEEFMKDIR